MIPSLERREVDLERVGDLSVVVSRTRHEHAVLYLHGFPGPYHVLPPGESRVVDHLYDALTTGHDFYYPRYTLKTGGPFSLDGTIEDGRRALNFVLERRPYASVTLVAQSWGAVIGANLAREYAFARVVLIVPFLMVPTGIPARRLIERFAVDCPGLVPPTNVDTFVGQMERIAREFDPTSALAEYRGPLSVYAAERDDIVPFDRLEALLREHPTARLVKLAGQTHDVENRAELGALIEIDLEDQR